MRPLIGVGLVGIGAVLVFGGMTGRLAPMLAALFAPSALDFGQDLTQPLTSNSQRTAAGAAAGHVNPVDAFTGRGATTEHP